MSEELIAMAQSVPPVADSLPVSPEMTAAAAMAAAEHKGTNNVGKRGNSHNFGDPLQDGDWDSDDEMIVEERDRSGEQVMRRWLVKPANKQQTIEVFHVLPNPVPVLL